MHIWHVSLAMQLKATEAKLGAALKYLGSAVSAKVVFSRHLLNKRAR